MLQVPDDFEGDGQCPHCGADIEAARGKRLVVPSKKSDPTTALLRDILATQKEILSEIRTMSPRSVGIVAIYQRFLILLGCVLVAIGAIGWLLQRFLSSR